VEVDGVRPRSRRAGSADAGPSCRSGRGGLQRHGGDRRTINKSPPCRRPRTGISDQPGNIVSACHAPPPNPDPATTGHACPVSYQLALSAAPHARPARYILIARGAVSGPVRAGWPHTPELVEPATRRAGCDELRRTRSLARAAPGSDGRTPRQDWWRPGPSRGPPERKNFSCARARRVMDSLISATSLAGRRRGEPMPPLWLAIGRPRSRPVFATPVILSLYLLSVSNKTPEVNKQKLEFVEWRSLLQRSACITSDDDDSIHYQLLINMRYCVDFDRNRRLSRKRYEIGYWLLRIIDRKS